MAPTPIPYDWSKKSLKVRMKKMKTDDLTGSMDPISQCYAAITSLTGSQGERICDDFMELPSQQDYRDYYRKIRDPISLNQIKRKIDKASYEGNFDEFEQDVNLLVRNAKLYNHPDSGIFHNATRIKVCAIACFPLLQLSLRELGSLFRKLWTNSRRSTEMISTIPSTMIFWTPSLSRMALSLGSASLCT